MGFTDYPNGLTSFGVPIVPDTFFGKHYFVDRKLGTDDNPGTSWDQAKKTIVAGYALLRDGYNDVLHIQGTASAYAQTAVLTLDKSYAHIVGHASPIYTGGRVRITNTVTTATAGEFVISGVGSVFKNIHFQWGGSATATSVVGTALSGDGRNAFLNCHFEGPTDATVAGGTAIRALTITSSQDNLFKGCSFGGDTILSSSAAGSVISFNGTNNSRNVFEDCIFVAYNSTTTSATVNYVNNGMATSNWNLFRNCVFHSSSGTVVADTIRYTTSALGATILQNCALTGTGIAVWATGAWKAVIEVCNPINAVAGGLGFHPA